MDWGRVGIILFRKRGDAIRCIEAFYDRDTYIYSTFCFLPSKAIFILKDGAFSTEEPPQLYLFYTLYFFVYIPSHDFDFSSGLNVYFILESLFLVDVYLEALNGGGPDNCRCICVYILPLP